MIERQDDLGPGRITSIRAQSKAPDRVSIYIDGRFAVGIHRDVLLEFDVRKGGELDLETQRAMLRRDAAFRARSAAFRYLSHRDRTVAEMRHRLERARFEADVVEEVVEHLRAAGYVDDRSYARTYAETRFSTSGYGPVRVRADLLRRGVSPEEAESAVEHVFAEHDRVLERARQLGRKRWQRLQGERDQLKRRKKVFDYLARRGFSYEVALEVVDDVSRI